MAAGNNKPYLWRIVGVSFITIVLWAIASLSDTYTWRLEIPFTVNLPPNQALTESVPQQIEMTVEADGWTLMKMMATGRPECVIYPNTLNIDGEQTRLLTQRELENSIRMDASASVRGVHPDTVRLTVGAVGSKKVPLLYPGITINTRNGFQVIGGTRVSPDSITLTGSIRALEGITRWYTHPLVMDDVHRSVREIVQISDSLVGIVEAEPSIARIFADVQEMAEQVYTDIPLVNRATNPDTNLTLVINPQRITVMVRGGVCDLSQLDPKQINAYVDVVVGVDTIGITRPRVVPPPGSSVKIVSVQPERVRYLWRREAN